MTKLIIEQLFNSDFAGGGSQVVVPRLEPPGAALAVGMRVRGVPPVAGDHKLVVVPLPPHHSGIPACGLLGAAPGSLQPGMEFELLPGPTANPAFCLQGFDCYLLAGRPGFVLVGVAARAFPVGARLVVETARNGPLPCVCTAIEGLRHRPFAPAHPGESVGVLLTPEAPMEFNSPAQVRDLLGPFPTVFLEAFGA